MPGSVRGHPRATGRTPSAGMRRVWQIALWVIGNGKFPEGVKVKSGALHAKRSEPRTSGYPRLSRGWGVTHAPD